MSIRGSRSEGAPCSASSPKSSPGKRYAEKNTDRRSESYAHCNIAKCGTKGRAHRGTYSCPQCDIYRKARAITLQIVH